MSTRQEYDAWLQRREQFQTTLRDPTLSSEEREELRDELTQIELIIEEMDGRPRKPFLLGF